MDNNNNNNNNTNIFTKITRVLLYIYIVCGIIITGIGIYFYNKTTKDNKPNILSKDIGKLLSIIGILMIIFNLILLLLTNYIPNKIDTMVLIQFFGFIIGIISLLIHIKK